jgi:hypothetical protein
MALTNNCDLFASFHENGMNKIVNHIMRQRPSLLNYATPDIIANRELWCHIPSFTSDVTKFGNPIFTELPYLPVIGTDSPPIGLGFTLQIVRFQVDLHPSNLISLPPELGPKLKPQTLAMELRVCGAVVCPDAKALDAVPVTKPTGQKDPDRPETPPPLVPVPGRLKCFCLDLFAVGHIAREFISGEEKMLAKVDGIEIVDVEPDELESNLECYLRSTVHMLLRQKLAIAWQTFFVEFPLFGTSKVSLFPTPNPPIPHNPAIADDQLKAFVTMTVTP